MTLKPLQDKQAKTVVIAGGAGDVGEEITRRFLSMGYNVVVPSRSRSKLDHLSYALNDVSTKNLYTMAVDVTSEFGGAGLVTDCLNRFGAVDGVIVALGSWHSKGTLDEFSLPEWSGIIQGGLTAHFSMAHHFVPVLRDRPDSFFIFVNGAAALTPIPHSGPVSIVAAAQEMMKNVLAFENRNHALRVNALMLKAVIETRASRGNPHATLAAKDVACYLGWLASPEAAHLRGQTVAFSHVSQLPKTGG
jgi:NAD(P)-dependent dehydrogenase (short-subunit alcohol dehydrogenase family)